MRTDSLRFGALQKKTTSQCNQAIKRLVIRRDPFHLNHQITNALKSISQAIDVSSSLRDSDPGLCHIRWSKLFINGVPTWVSTLKHQSGFQHRACGPECKLTEISLIRTAHSISQEQTKLLDCRSAQPVHISARMQRTTVE
jgi:hypothetical protein